jgi:hypothetical protein
VAEGTLDVLLWDLLEKKFRDLGEFVEGKEKMKIVVHKTYDSIEELKSMFSTFDKGDFDVIVEEHEHKGRIRDEEGLIKLEDDLQQDITQLAQEEMVMISAGIEGEDDDGGDPNTNGETMNEVGRAGPGQSEDDAICIIDDDNDDDDNDNPEVKMVTEADLLASIPDEKKTEDKPERVKSLTAVPSPTIYDFSKALRRSRLYSQTFEGNAFGIQLFTFNGRMVIAQNTNNNGSTKPAVGDILVSVNGKQIVFGCNLHHLLSLMKTALTEGPVELNFVEDQEFAEFFQTTVMPMLRARETAARRPHPMIEDKNGIIELLDDD